MYELKNYLLPIFFFISARLLAQVSDTAKYASQDSITAHQTNIGFNSVTDGQPAPPKQPFFSIIASGQQGGKFQYQGSIGYTPACKGFLRNTLFVVVVPTIDVGEGITDFEKSVSGSWQQRWIYEHNGKPTISTMTSIQIPYDEPNAKTDLVTTLIITKDIGKGVGYFNAYAETTSGFTTDSLSYGIMAGYKIYLTKHEELFFGLMYQTNNTLTLETSIEIDFKSGMTISPGLNLAYNTQFETTTFGGGIVLYYQSSKTSGRKKSSRKHIL